jgi:Polyketide cyclase / dehydrase and lipid transport
MIHVVVSTTIRASPVQVIAIYRDYQHWSRLFPTIRGVRLLEQNADTMTLEVDHREGRVVNLMTVVSPEEIRLEEFKRFYDAIFLNRFEADATGTRYIVIGDIRLKGAARLLAPFLGEYVRQQMRRFVLEPVKQQAELISSRV